MIRKAAAARLCVWVACFVILPTAVVAQSAIGGVVTDNTGGVLPGVTVEAASRAHSRFPGHALTPTGVMAIRCKQFHLPDL